MSLPSFSFHLPDPPHVPISPQPPTHTLPLAPQERKRIVLARAHDMDDERPNCTIPEQHQVLEQIDDERHGKVEEDTNVSCRPIVGLGGLGECFAYICGTHNPIE